MSTKVPFLRATVVEQKPIHANLLIAAAVNSGEENPLECLPVIKYPAAHGEHACVFSRGFYVNVPGEEFLIFLY